MVLAVIAVHIDLSGGGGNHERRAAARMRDVYVPGEVACPAHAADLGAECPVGSALYTPYLPPR